MVVVFRNYGNFFSYFISRSDLSSELWTSISDFLTPVSTQMAHRHLCMLETNLSSHSLHPQPVCTPSLVFLFLVSGTTSCSFSQVRNLLFLSSHHQVPQMCVLNKQISNPFTALCHHHCDCWVQAILLSLGPGRSPHTWCPSITPICILFCSWNDLPKSQSQSCHSPFKPISGTLFPLGGTHNSQTASLSVSQRPLQSHCPSFLQFLSSCV